MDEFVSKEAVLELLCRECAENCTGGTPYRCYVPCAEWKLINALPAADVKPVVRGEWIPDDYAYYRCDQCGYEHDEPELTTPFCPNCGADMREESDE